MKSFVSKAHLKLVDNQLEGINYKLFDVLLKEVDFTKTKNTLEALKLFYENIYLHAICELENEVNSLHKETGRLIIEVDDHQRENIKLKEEIASLREQIQGQSPKSPEADPED